MIYMLYLTLISLKEQENQRKILSFSIPCRRKKLRRPRSAGDDPEPEGGGRKTDSFQPDSG